MDRPYSEAAQSAFELRSGFANCLDHHSRLSADEQQSLRLSRRSLRQDPGESGLRRLWSAAGLCLCGDSEIVVRGGYGISYVHYTRAGSGDILAINAPNALFVSVTQPSRHGGLSHGGSGLPPGLGHHLQPGDGQHHVHSQKHPGQLRTGFLPRACRTSWQKTACWTSPLSATTESSCRVS